MKLNESIKQKLILFTKRTYYLQYQSILLDMSRHSSYSHKELTSFHQEKTNCNKIYWDKLTMALFNNNEEYQVSQLVVCYLKHKAHDALLKLKSIAHKFDFPLESVIDNYFYLCDLAMKPKEIKPLIQKTNIKKKTICSIPKVPMNLRQGPLNNNNNNHNKHRRISIEKRSSSTNHSTIDVSLPDIEDKEQENVTKTNIVIGEIDIQKLVNNKQRIIMKKCTFGQTFIIRDIGNGSHNDTKKPIINNRLQSENKKTKLLLNMTPQFSPNMSEAKTIGFPITEPEYFQTKVDHRKRSVIEINSKSSISLEKELKCKESVLHLPTIVVHNNTRFIHRNIKKVSMNNLGHSHSQKNKITM